MAGRCYGGVVAERARIKRSLSPGFAGIDNDLFYEPNTSMLFADAKRAATEIASEVQRL